MKIGIDISQMAYQNTGVANYMENLISQMIRLDKKNKYILFYSSLRNNPAPILEKLRSKSYPNVLIKCFRFPPAFLDLMWNRFHWMPIENLIGDIDLFISSDWTQPPTRKALKATILYDLIVYKFPKETDEMIVSTQMRRLKWVKKEADMIFCISEATRKDAKELLGIDEERLCVTYPGI